MEIKNINKSINTGKNKKLIQEINEFGRLINELKKKKISAKIINLINLDITNINSFIGLDKDLQKLLRKVQYKILKLVKTEHNLVTKNHYRNKLLVAGMSIFGIPLGIVIGACTGNMALGIGIPIGMAIGAVIGIIKDKKAFKEGRQLDLTS
jgi:hypothetical protein